VGSSASESSTALISRTIGSSSASTSPGSGGLAFAGGRIPAIVPEERGRTGRRGRCTLRLVDAPAPPRLPLEMEDIKAILPHRYPFLLVDRILELEPDTRVLGLKNVSSDERYFIAGPGGVPMLPASILTEAMAQAGAVLILSKPENRSRLIYFMGIDRVRYRSPVRAGDSVLLEGVVVRLRSKMGVLRGVARVDRRIVCEGQMTFALAERSAAP
jgi:3-hydroxyacyl-[acyl-carrier-protein] dehydratase